MGNGLTHFQRAQLDRAWPYADGDGWELMHQVDNEPRRNCADRPVDVFFPAADEDVRGEIKRRERERIAGECAGCPVADACLAGALLRGERYGSWGGVAQPDFQAVGRAFRARLRREDATEEEAA